MEGNHPILGGGNSNMFFYFHPDPWGKLIQFDYRIFFRWVGEKPPASIGDIRYKKGPPNYYKWIYP